jgi:hypothetical protein
MNEQMKRLTEKMKSRPQATEEGIEDAETELGIIFPEEYREFMLESNGAIGCIGENSYLNIWAIENIAQYNADYEVNEYNPGLVYFGSSGGGLAYAFDKRKKGTPIVSVPFQSIDLIQLEQIADTFTGFLQHLYDFED